MKTPLVLLFLGWSTLALALGGPNKALRAGMPNQLREGHAPMSAIAVDQSHVQHATSRGRNSRGSDPWGEQVTGLPEGYWVYGLDAVDSATVWGFAYTTEQAGYAATRMYIRTTNGGTTWICDSVRTAPANYSISGISACDANRAWVCMYSFYNVTSSGGIFRTTDGGVTWERDPAAFKNPLGGAEFIHFFDPENGVCVGDPTLGYFEIYTTSNGGASWSRVPAANIPAPLVAEAAWWDSYSAAGNSLWFPTAADNKPGRIFRTTDRGLTWSVHDYPDVLLGQGTTLAFRDENVGLGNGNWGEVSRTTDGGSTWAQGSSLPHLIFYGMAYIPGTSGMYIGPSAWWYPDVKGDYIYGTVYTLDGGANWTVAPSSDVYLCVDFLSASIGWRSSTTPNVYKWQMAQGRVLAMSMDSLKFDSLKVGSVSGTVIVDAVNFGSDLVTVTGINAPDTDFTVAEQPSYPAVLPPLGSVRFKICFTPQSGGELWDSLSIVSDASNAPSIVTLFGIGDPWIAVTQENRAPVRYQLEQNYPNPFNPSTTITFELPRASQVTLNVYDILGREVSVLVNERREAGVHEVRFHGSGLSSGVYLYRLRAGDFVQTRKLLLLQ